MEMIATLTIAVLFCGAIASPLNETQKINIEEKIVGGKLATNGQLPYQASIRTTQNNKHFCGGSILNSQWLLTSASCVFTKAPNSITVVVGTNKLNSGGYPYSIIQVVVHPSYNNVNNINDIALLKIAGNIVWHNNIRPVILADTVTPGGNLCTFSGWGTTSSTSTIFSNDLKYILLNSITTLQCQNYLQGQAIFSTNVCTFQGSGEGACNGDHGGPLICKGTQNGILSWITPCAKGKPDVFTNVAAYRSWIKSYTGI